EEQAGPARDRVVDGRDAPTPSTARAEPLHLDPEHELVAGAHDPPEPSLLDPAEQRQAAGVAGIGKQRDPTRLGQRLELDHARNAWTGSNPPARRPGGRFYCASQWCSPAREPSRRPWVVHGRAIRRGRSSSGPRARSVNRSPACCSTPRPTTSGAPATRSSPY